MSSSEVDARGKLCPVPVVMTKKVYDTLNEGDQMSVLIDNDTSAENVAAFVLESGGLVESAKEGDVTTLTVTKGAIEKSKEAGDYCAPPKRHVIYISSDIIGTQGSEELGKALMQSFIQTIKDVTPLPSHIIFINRGVKLLIEGSKLAEAAKELEKLGVKITACGTCLDYFDLMDKIVCGQVSNMYDILNLLTRAGHVIKP